MNHDIFISYSSKQKNIADGVCHYLEENGFKCWMAPRDIPGGSKYGDCIYDAIIDCKVFVLVFSESASSSPWVNGEIHRAFSNSKPILPFRVDETQVKGDLDLMLNQFHWIDAFPHYADRLPDLLKSVCGFLDCRPRKVFDETERLEDERKAKEAAEKVRREKERLERIEAVRKAKEAVEWEKLEKERLAKEEAERKIKEVADRERIEKEKIEEAKQKTKEEAERARKEVGDECFATVPDEEERRKKTKHRRIVIIIEILVALFFATMCAFGIIGHYDGNFHSGVLGLIVGICFAVMVFFIMEERFFKKNVPILPYLIAFGIAIASLFVWYRVESYKVREELTECQVVKDYRLFMQKYPQWDNKRSLIVGFWDLMLPNPSSRWFNQAKAFVDRYVADSMGWSQQTDSIVLEQALQQSQQPRISEEVEEQEIFHIVEEMPKFTGGEQKLMEFVAKNVKYPSIARNSGIQGRVYVSFVVETDGSISNVKVLRGIGGGCDEEVVRVVKSMPKWEPGKHGGKAVRVSYMIPVDFKL